MDLLISHSEVTSSELWATKPTYRLRSADFQQKFRISLASPLSSTVFELGPNKKRLLRERVDPCTRSLIIKTNAERDVQSAKAICRGMKFPERVFLQFRPVSVYLSLCHAARIEFPWNFRSPRRSWLTIAKMALVDLNWCLDTLSLPLNVWNGFGTGLSR